MTKSADPGAHAPHDPLSRLRPQSRQVLLVLEEHEGRLVTKDALMERVWAGTHVTDDSLVQCIADIRRALGPEEAGRLRTVPRKGYVLDPPAAAPARPRRRLPLAHLALAALVLVAAVLLSRPEAPPAAPERPVLAILPFRNASDAADFRYLSDGVAEDLIVALSELGDLSVLSRGTTFGLADTDLPDLAARLGADYVLEGTLRVAGDDLRLTATLARGVDGAAIWARAWDGGRGDILAFQGEVLTELTRVLSVRLSRDERRRLGVRGTESIEAHDAYLRARELENFYTPDTNRAAERDPKKALGLDPDYALAHAHLSQVMSFRVENDWTTTREADIASAFDHAERAVALDPRLPFARFALGRLYTRSFAHDRPGAIDRAHAEFATATELDADYVDAYVFRANILIFDGQAERALPLIEEGFARNPVPPYWYWLAEGMTRFFLGDYDRAETFLLRARDQNPTAPFPHRFLIATLGAAGRSNDAEWAAVEYEALGRKATVAAMIASASISDPEYLDRFATGLRRAGLPED